MQRIIDSTVRDIEILLDDDKTIKIDSVSYYAEEDVLNRTGNINEKIILVEDVFRNEQMDNIKEDASFSIKVTYPIFNDCKEYLGDKVETYENMHLVRRIINRGAEREFKEIIYVFSNGENNIQGLISEMLERKENKKIEWLRKKVDYLNTELRRSQLNINTLQVNMSSILTTVNRLENSILTLQKKWKH